jgi:hypothetical protein
MSGSLDANSARIGKTFGSLGTRIKTMLKIVAVRTTLGRLGRLRLRCFPSCGLIWDAPVSDLNVLQSALS